MKANLNVVDSVLNKYGIPLWVKPYIYDYIKSDPLNAVKHATSFIEVRRKKGEVTGKYVKLPNSTMFDMDSVIHILSLFFYGEERSTEMYRKWSSEPAPESRDYSNFYRSMVAVREKHARAIKNLIEGLGRKSDKPTKRVIEVFDFIESLKDWRERMITTDLLMRYAYGVSFGVTFYKTFYFVMPEYMRSFGKAFGETTNESLWGENEAKRIITEKGLPEERIVELSEEVISRIVSSIDSEMEIAKKAKIEKEAKLLRTISIVYPLHTILELGVVVDIEDEIKKINKMAKR